MNIERVARRIILSPLNGKAIFGIDRDEETEKE